MRLAKPIAQLNQIPQQNKRYSYSEAVISKKYCENILSKISIKDIETSDFVNKKYKEAKEELNIIKEQFPELFL